MKSSGGITTSDVAQKKPIMTIQSGPAGGVIGAQRLADILKIKHMVVADVGGTSFDVSLIYDGRYLESTSSKLHRRPILQPTIDIVSIGAGGGSIAWIDQEAGLRVGPQSAEADPGPVCFSMGGEEPTVTDAQLVLGYLNPKTYLGKRMYLDLDAAREAIKVKIAEKLHLSTEEAAAGIIQIAATNMAYAVRQITVERGHDPREFSLTCIGGGGGLFAGEILKELQMKQAILPQNPAVFSAWGLLNADYREDVTKPFLISRKDVTPKALKTEFRVLENEVRKWFSSENIDFNKMTIERFAEMRYLGQEHTLKIPINKEDFLDSDLIKLRDRFDIHYKKAYSHALPNHDIEFVILRLAAIGTIDKPDLSKINPCKNNGILKSSEERQVYMPNKKHLFSCKVFQRDELSSGIEIIGPAFIEEWNSTILIHSEQRAEVDDLGNLFIKVKT
jgi:N-methylhydantoinase A